MSWSLALAEQGWVPDGVVRGGIRGRCSGVLWELHEAAVARCKREGIALQEAFFANKMDFIHSLREQPIALATKTANEQHYEVPTEFFKLVMGKNMKYSCCWYNDTTKTLDEAEDNMLNQYCEKAQLADGMDVMDLGCGWGSVSLFVAKKYPNSRITSVSNSATQREYIEAEAKKRGINNIQVITADIVSFTTDKKFHRVISIEMFEHMKNYELLLQKISSWLHPEGLLFVHYFSHREYPYHFKDGDWMSDNFFSGGTMPSHDLLLYFQKDLQLMNHWKVSGQHYEKTSNDWLKNMDANLPQIRKIFDQVYGKDKTQIWIGKWRLFFLAVAELFGYAQGEEWLVSLFLFKKR